MKRIIVIALVALCTAEMINAQRLWTIIFADTKDPKIGLASIEDLFQFRQFKSALSASIDMADSETTIIRSESNCNKAELLRVLENFNCNSEDIVLFAYFGHGTRAVMDPSPFPQMCLGSTEQSQFYPLKGVYDRLISKGPRFCMVIGDCCNKTSTYVMPQRCTFADEPAAMSCTRIRTYSQAALKKLFLENKGSVIGAGCKPEQLSWCNSSDGSYFSMGFLDELINYSKERQSNYDWTTLMTRVTTNVENRSRNANLIYGGERYIQTPIWEVNVSPCVYGGGKRRVSDGIRTLLVALADDRRSSPSTRLGMVQSVASNFSSSATIDLVSLDDKVVVERNDLQTFLLHVATTFQLRNFDIRDEKRDSEGKITYIRLHEIYLE